MKKIKEIIIHCSATPNGREFHADDIKRWHTDPKPQGRGWKHAGYHFVIPLSGETETLVPLNDDDIIEPWEIANGAHGHNQHAVHICLIGFDQFTAWQWEALEQLVIKLRNQCPDATVHGHREFAPYKTCPGFDVALWITEPARIEMLHLLATTS